MSIFSKNTPQPEQQPAVETVQAAPVHVREVAKNRDDLAQDTAWVRMENRHFTVVLFAMVCLSLLLIMAMGSNGFKSLVLGKEANTQTRLLSTAIATDIRLEDETGSISRADGPEGDALIMTEHTDTGTYEQRYYVANGWLVKEYVVAGSSFSPSTAAKVTKTNTFSFSVKNNLLTFETDEGTNYVFLRSTQADIPAKGGAQSRV